MGHSLKNATLILVVLMTISKHTKKYLALAEKEGRVINVSYELPKSFVVSIEEDRAVVYISQLSSQTLNKRFIQLGT